MDKAEATAYRKEIRRWLKAADEAFDTPAIVLAPTNGSEEYAILLWIGPEIEEDDDLVPDAVLTQRIERKALFAILEVEEED